MRWLVAFAIRQAGSLEIRTSVEWVGPNDCVSLKMPCEVRRPHGNWFLTELQVCKPLHHCKVLHLFPFSCEVSQLVYGRRFSSIPSFRPRWPWNGRPLYLIHNSFEN